MNQKTSRTIFALMVVLLTTLGATGSVWAQTQDGCWNTNNLAWYPTGTTVPSGSTCLENNTWRHPNGQTTFPGGTGNGQVQTAPVVQYQAPAPPPQIQTVYVADPATQAAASQAEADKQRLAAQLAVAQTNLATANAILAASRDANPLITVGGEKDSALKMISEPREVVSAAADTVDLSKVELGELARPNWLMIMGTALVAVAGAVWLLLQFSQRRPQSLEVPDEGNLVDRNDPLQVAA